MKAGWQTRKLAYVLVRTETLNPEMTPDAEFDYIDVSSVSNSSFQIEQTQRIKGKDAPSRARKLVRANDVLFATIRPTLKRIAIVPSERDSQVCSTGYFVLRTNADLHHKFLYYYLFNDSFMSQMEALQKGASYPAVTDAEVRSQQISFPIIQEQQRIVTILDEAFEGIATATANAKKNLAYARELFESYLQSVFTNKGEGWVDKTIKDLTTILGDGLHGTPQYTIDGDYYFINGNNLSDGVIELKESTKRVSVDEFNRYKKNLTDRTILVSINGTLGNVAFYNGEKVILGKSACYFNLKDEVDKNFVKYILTSPYFLQYAHKEATGATIKNVSLKTMREFKVPLPSYVEQQIIVNKLDTLNSETKKLEAIYQQKLFALEELKKSILNQAFSGQLN